MMLILTLFTQQTNTPAILIFQDGKMEPDGTVGRLLMEMVSQVPQFEGTKFEVMLNSAMQASGR